jgi:signal transduction histidine kinase
MGARTAGRLAWFLAILAASLAVAGAIFGLKNGSDLVSYNGVFELVGVLGFAVLGAILASRRPTNAIGWIYVGTAVTFALSALGDQAATYGFVTNPRAVPGAAIGAWLSVWVWAPASGLLMVFSLLLFPDGRLPSPRWRPVAWLGALGIVLITVPVALEGWPLRGPRLLYANEPPPTLPAAFRLAVHVQQWAFLVMFLLALASAISLVVRFRRASGDEREQIRWVAFGGGLLILGFVSNTLTNNNFLGIIGLAGLPVASTIAILKYRLYDIDVVINKTVVYGLLAAFFTVVYVAIVVGIGTAFGSRSSRLLTVLAAVVMAVAFQPVREWARRLANRLVYGKRATPYEVLSDFSERAAGAYSTEDVLPRMARILAEGTGATRAEVWLRVGDELRPTASWPQGSEMESARLRVAGDELPEFPGNAGAFPVRHQGELLGALTLDKPPSEPLTPTETKLLTDLASQVGLVLRNVRLTSELQARLEDLRASRQRLVVAQDEERRRLERNLHDGAQQQLVALAVKLGIAETLARKDPDRTAEMLSGLKADTGEALDNLRDLARGIYPPLLADKGLGAALDSQARKAAVPTTVEVDSVGRYPQEVEAAVYFCCLEALQNVAKYASASTATIRLLADHGSLRFEIEDDGAGFETATTGYGTGLQGMADRLDAIGGTFEVRSRPGEGTTVLGGIPVPAVGPANERGAARA